MYVVMFEPSVGTYGLLKAHWCVIRYWIFGSSIGNPLLEIHNLSIASESSHLFSAVLHTVQPHDKHVSKCTSASTFRSCSFKRNNNIRCLKPAYPLVLWTAQADGTYLTCMFKSYVMQNMYDGEQCTGLNCWVEHQLHACSVMPVSCCFAGMVSWMHGWVFVLLSQDSVGNVPCNLGVWRFPHRLSEVMLEVCAWNTCGW